MRDGEQLCVCKNLKSTTILPVALFLGRLKVPSYVEDRRRRTEATKLGMWDVCMVCVCVYIVLYPSHGKGFIDSIPSLLQQGEMATVPPPQLLLRH